MVKGGIIIFEYSYLENKESLLSKCYEWINTPELEILVEQFGRKIPQGLGNEEKLHWLVEFSKNWDFRGVQKAVYDLKTGEKARWLVDNSALSEQQVSATMNAAETLGMVDCTLPIQTSYDYILVLGGARMSCFFRMKYAKELCDSHGITANEIVGLTGMRPISESERSATDTYALGAGTEFDLMCAAAQTVLEATQVETLKQTICHLY